MAGKKRVWGSCSFVKPDGTKCKGFALKGADRCFQHPRDEEGKKRKAEANRNGGRNKAGRGAKQQQQALLAAYRFETVQHVIEEYQKVYGDMRAHTAMLGFVDYRAGEAQANVLDKILKALGTMKLEELAEKIHRLEEQQAQQAAKRLTLGNAGEQIPFEPVPFTDPRDDQSELFDEYGDAAGLTPPVQEVEDFVAGFGGRQPDPGPDPGQPGNDVFAGGDDTGAVAGEAVDDQLYADDAALLTRCRR
jgi:hypothetical protein